MKTPYRQKSNCYIYGLYAKERFQRLFYVGKGTNNRMYRHSKEEPKDTHKRRVMNKYACYPMFILGGITEKFAYALEEKLIALFPKQLTNKSKGGIGGNTGRKVSSITKAKMSKAQKALDRTPRTLKHLDFVAYNFWAFKISKLSMAQYCQNKSFSYTCFKKWRSVHKSLIDFKYKAVKKYSRFFKNQVLNQFKQSSLSKPEFARLINLPYGTFIRFLKELN